MFLLSFNYEEDLVGLTLAQSWVGDWGEFNSETNLPFQK